MDEQSEVTTGSEPLGQSAGGDASLGGSLHPRLAWMMCYQETRNVQAVCRKFGISRKTFYKWLKRYQQDNGSTTALADRSRRPHRFPRATPESSIQILKEAREEHNILFHDELNKYIGGGDSYKRARPFHATILAKNQDFLKKC